MLGQTITRVWEENGGDWQAVLNSPEVRWEVAAANIDPALKRALARALYELGTEHERPVRASRARSPKRRRPNEEGGRGNDAATTTDDDEEAMEEEEEEEEEGEMYYGQSDHTLLFPPEDPPPPGEHPFSPLFGRYPLWRVRDFEYTVDSGYLRRPDWNYVIRYIVRKTHQSTTHPRTVERFGYVDLNVDESDASIPSAWRRQSAASLEGMPQELVRRVMLITLRNQPLDLPVQRNLRGINREWRATWTAVMNEYRAASVLDFPVASLLSTNGDLQNLPLPTTQTLFLLSFMQTLKAYWYGYLVLGKGSAEHWMPIMFVEPKNPAWYLSPVRHDYSETLAEKEAQFAMAMALGAVNVDSFVPLRYAPNSHGYALTKTHGGANWEFAGSVDYMDLNFEAEKARPVANRVAKIRATKIERYRTGLSVFNQFEGGEGGELSWPSGWSYRRFIQRLLEFSSDDDDDEVTAPLLEQRYKEATCSSLLGAEIATSQKVANCLRRLIDALAVSTDGAITRFESVIPIVEAMVASMRILYSTWNFIDVDDLPMYFGDEIEKGKSFLRAFRLVGGGNPSVVGAAIYDMKLPSILAHTEPLDKDNPTYKYTYRYAGESGTRDLSLFVPCYQIVGPYDDDEPQADSKVQVRIIFGLEKFGRELDRIFQSDVGIVMSQVFAQGAEFLTGELRSELRSVFVSESRVRVAEGVADFERAIAANDKSVDDEMQNLKQAAMRVESGETKAFSRDGVWYTSDQDVIETYQILAKIRHWRGDQAQQATDVLGHLARALRKRDISIESVLATQREIEQKMYATAGQV